MMHLASPKFVVYVKFKKLRKSTQDHVISNIIYIMYAFTLEGTRGFWGKRTRGTRPTGSR